MKKAICVAFITLVLICSATFIGAMTIGGKPAKIIIYTSDPVTHIMQGIGTPHEFPGAEYVYVPNPNKNLYAFRAYVKVDDNG